MARQGRPEDGVAGWQARQGGAVLEELGLGSARARLLGGWIEAARSDELGAQELLDADLTARDGWMIGGSGEVAGYAWVGEEVIWEDPKIESGGDG